MAQEQATSPKPEDTTKPTNLTGQDEFVDEEIDLPDEEGEVKEAKEPEEVKKRRGPRRYSVLTNERDEARNYAAQLQAELEAERGLRTKAEGNAAASAKAAMLQYASSVEIALKEARSAHSAALTTGDPDAITEAAEALASAKSTSDDMASWQKSEANKPAPTSELQPATQMPTLQDAPPEIRDWMIENRWYDPFKRNNDGQLVVDRTGRPLKNDDYDEEMNEEATYYAKKLERQINSGQKNIKISSPEYFREIEKHMEGQYPEYFGGDEAEEEAQPERKSSPVAGASRSVPRTQGNQQGVKVKLTAGTIRFVEKMVENGGGPKYPKGHPQQFKPMTLTDAKVSFARQMRNQAQQGKEN